MTQVEIDFDLVPWCSWCGELPSGGCTHGRKWWRCDPCHGHGVLWVSDAFGVAILPPQGVYS